jgi:hypothetical protein
MEIDQVDPIDLTTHGCFGFSNFRNREKFVYIHIVSTQECLPQISSTTPKRIRNIPSPTLQSILDIDEQALQRELANTENYNDGHVWKHRLTEKLQALQNIAKKL